MDSNVINSTIEFVKAKLYSDSTGHDWWHSYRVWKNAKQIAKLENCNIYIVELAALLHDIADHKFNNGDITVGPKVAKEWLSSINVDEAIINKVCEIICEVSFKGANVNSGVSSIEAKIVQDADRLDAIGAIGIARTFAYGGSKNREMYNPDIKPILHESFEEYKNSKAPTINHFYEKLLLLKDKMNTKTGKELAIERHEIMVKFLDDFCGEWDCD